MAEVTRNSQKYNVNGSLRDQYYNISGSSGDTLTVGMNGVRQVNFEVSTITGYSAAPGSNPGQTIITITASAPFAAVDTQVVGN